MRILMIDDDSTRGMALQGGQVDIVQRIAWKGIPTFEADSNMQVFDTQGARTRILSFNYENPGSVSRDRVNAVEIRIIEHIDYGTSAYPLMVLFALRKFPKTQDQIFISCPA